MLPSIENIDRFAIFLDVDGTLVEIADRPDSVRLEADTLRLLEALSVRTGRALAVVSGRDIAAVDRLLHPLVLPAAGVHGLQRRDAGGRLHKTRLDSLELEEAVKALEEQIGKERGVLIEPKTGAVALHYRLRPELEARCREIAETIVRNRPDLELMKGKMVYEMRLQGSDKGDVIEAFLREPPFRGRTPIFAGDDLTDEIGFAIVNAHGGISIKIGESSTLARFRAANVRELLSWLSELACAPRKERAS
jgi:trehalose 6-phosphate phosphatase